MAGANPALTKTAGDRGGSPPTGVTPGLVPVVADGIDHAAVGLEELVRDLEHREEYTALGRPCGVAAALLTPDEFADAAFQSLRRAFLVDQTALEHVGLLDIDVLVVRQHRPRRKP